MKVWNASAKGNASMLMSRALCGRWALMSLSLNHVSVSPEKFHE